MGNAIRNQAAPVALLYLILGLLSFAPQHLHAQSPAEPGSYDEAQAQSIDRQIMCPVCPAETIDQAQVPIARQMRQMVRDQLAQGASEAEILDFFAQRYGQDILASPPKTGINLVAWIFPLVGVAAALAAGWFVLRSMTRNRSVMPQPANNPGSDLEPYLAIVDREIDLRSSRDASTSSTSGVEAHREGGPSTDG